MCISISRLWHQQACENPDTENTCITIFNYTDINSFLQLLLGILYSFLALVYKRVMHCPSTGWWNTHFR